MFTITADELPRFMQCNGSRLMPATMPPVETDQSARDEGTAAHWLASEVFNGRTDLLEMADRKAPNGVYITPEMIEHVEEYLNAIVHIDRGDLTNAMEIETSFGNDQWRVNARADHMGYVGNSNTVYVDDFKYGWRIVEPKMNWTLIAHAIGYCITRQIQPREIVLTIHQPRPFHRDGKSREWRITYDELTGYHQQLAATMAAPSDTLNTGPQCRKCHALPTCPAARAASMNAIDASALAFSDDIGNDLLSFELDTLRTAAATLDNRLSALEELAKHRLKAGQIVQGYGVEIQLSNLTWKEGMTAGLLLALTGKDLSSPKLITPTQAKKLVSEEIIKTVAERRQTGVKLVRMDASEKAEQIFGEKQR